MVLLLARCWDYKLKTEDVLELTQVCECRPALSLVHPDRIVVRVIVK